jgi:hypothetical protein
MGKRPIVGMIVAVNYHGELRQSLPSVVSQCDAVYIATSPEDAKTQAIIAENKATPILLDTWYARGAAFNKSGAVHHMQRLAYACHPNAWHLLLDADIVLPADCRANVMQLLPIPDTLFGMRRLDYETPEAFAADRPSFEYDKPHAGYFQLYCRKASFYAPWSHDASRCDWDFRKLFRRRVLVPGFAKHLGIKRQNWGGRTTPEWKPNAQDSRPL